MKNKFTTYEIALKLKELGFDEECFGWYYIGLPNSIEYSRCSGKNCVDVPVPLWQDAISWIFKKLDFYYPYLKVEIFSDGSGSWYQPRDKGVQCLDIEFNNLEQCILLAIKEIEKYIK